MPRKRQNRSLAKLPHAPAPVAGLTRDEREIVGKVSRLLGRSFEHIVEASGLWCGLSLETRNMLREAADRAGREVIDRLEAIGEKRMDVRLFWSENLAARYLARLPLAEQRRLIDDKIPVVAPHGSRLFVEERTYLEMTSLEVAQVFDNSDRDNPKVRTPQEQREWIRENLESNGAPEPSVQVRGWGSVRGDRFYPAASCVSRGLTAEDLRRALSEMG